MDNPTRSRRRSLFWVIIISIVGVFAFALTDEWRYRNFPNTCPLAKYLPKGTVAIKCEYDNIFVDYFYYFQATGSRSDTDLFVENLMDSLNNPRILPQPYIRINGRPIFSDDEFKISADGEISVDVSWSDGIITVYFSKT